jgi:hypothetical protein
MDNISVTLHEPDVLGKFAFLATGKRAERTAVDEEVDYHAASANLELRSTSTNIR